ncbi:rRNA methyltransferase [Acrocarpospora corrugata]|uniref:rRNA methyltransferase n=1 Tax=Acrocarpospora corrugata TaxID=35763 RepID=A0A5M3VXC2_9ACTN|nr:RNA methyltransferase [Acrocarpospora corrugata]GER99722.1 rRNA methyltransferase [Acrocarpospora corrugata]
MVIEVDSAADPRIADFTRLRDTDLRKALEPEQGLFLAEGEKVIRRALATGHPLRSVLTTRKWLPSFADLPADAPVYLASDEVMENITGFQVHRGALASLHRLPLPAVPELLGRARRVLVLEDLVDHGNVGAIFRCAAALGVDAVVLAPRCADPLYRRAVKVSMGAVFAIPYARMPDWYGGLADLRLAGFQTLALTPDQHAPALDKVQFADRVALLLGSEGDGLSSHWLAEADQGVSIPMSPAAMALGVDSLNVVAAAAIACHALLR